MHWYFFSLKWVSEYAALDKKWIYLVKWRSVCIKCKNLTSCYPFGIQFQHRRILHQHHHRLAFSWAQSFLAGATATYYLLPESDAIWCEHISCKFNFYSRKGEQAFLMPLHKPGNTHAKSDDWRKGKCCAQCRWKCQTTIHLHTPQKCKTEWHWGTVFSELMQSGI